MSDKDDQDSWKRYRRIIEHQYSQKGTRLLDVVKYMATHHHFFRRYACILRHRIFQSPTCSSKHQYERQLKKWGVRKKLSKAEWVAIIAYICANSLSNSEIEVLWHGAILSPEQIEREIKRYRSEVAQQRRSYAGKISSNKIIRY